MSGPLKIDSTTTTAHADSERKELASATLTPEQIAAMVGKDIQKVPVELVKHINSKEYQHLADNQVDGVPDANINLLLAEQKLRLGKERIKDMTHPGALQALLPEQHAHLNEKQRALLPPRAETPFDPKKTTEKSYTDEDIKKLSDDEIKALRDVRNIQRIPQDKFQILLPEQVNLLSGTCVNFLSIDQINNDLPAPGVVHLINKKLIQGLSDDKLPFVAPAMVNHLRPEKLKLLKKPKQIQNIRATNINAGLLDPSQYRSLSAAQIKLITNPEVVKQLPVELGKNIGSIDIEMVQYLKPECIPFLVTRDQIRQVKLENYYMFTENQWNQLLLLPQFVGKMKIDQLKHIPPHLVDQFNLSEAQLKDLKADKEDDRKFLRSLTSQLHQIDITLVPFLSDQQFPLLIRNNQIVWALENNKESLLTIKQVEYLSYENLKKLTRKDLIQAVNPNYLHHLIPTQYQHLSPSQVEGITDPEIVKMLPPELLPHVTDKSLVTEYMTDEQLKNVEDQDLLTRVLDNPRRESVLTAKQVNMLGAAVNKLSTPEKRAVVLPATAAQHFTANNIATMTPTQAAAVTDREKIKSIPDRLLVPAHVPYLEDSRIAKLRDPKLIEAVEPNRWHLLESRELSSVKPSELNKIFECDNYKEVCEKLPASQVAHIDVSKLPHNEKFLKQFIPSLRLTVEQVKKLPPTYLKFLSPVQVPHVRYYYLSDLGRTRFFQFTAAQKGYYLVQLAFKSAVSLSALCLVASLFHTPSRQWSIATLKTAFDLASTLTKHMVSLVKDKFKSPRA